MPPKKRTSFRSTAAPSSDVETTSKSRRRSIKVPSAGTSQTAHVPVSQPAKEPIPYSIKCFYPRENVKLATELEGTTKGVERAMTGAIDDHVVRLEVPVKKITTISKKVKERLVECGIERWSWDKFDEVLECVIFERTNEGDDEMFDAELIKYGLIGCSQFERLSMGTLLSIVGDVCRDEANVHEYEIGHPTKLASSVLKFYNLPEGEFMNLSGQKRRAMVKEYIEQGYKYHSEMKTFLEEKYESLLKRDESHDGNVDQEDLFEAFEKNEKLRKRLDEEYERIIDEEKTEGGVYRDVYRDVFLSGKMGIRREADEELLDVLLDKTPEDMKKLILHKCKDMKEDTTMQLSVSDAPNRNRKATGVEYSHTFIPVPRLHFRADHYDA